MEDSDMFQEQLLEDELNLQLSLLQDEMPPSTLFETPEHPFEENEKGTQASSVANQVKEAEQAHVFEELVEEGALESLAICALIAGLMFAPQLLGGG